MVFGEKNILKNLEKIPENTCHMDSFIQWPAVWVQKNYMTDAFQ